MTDIASLGIAVDSRGVAQGTAALDALGDQAAVTGAQVKTFSAATTVASTQTARAASTISRASQAFQRNGFAINNLANQFSDLAVQMSMGTSPARALSQQIPQMTVMMGPLANVIGVAAGVLIGLGGNFLFASDAAKSLQDTIDGVDVGALEGGLRDVTSAAKAYAEAIKATATAQGGATASIVADTKREFEAKKSLLELEVRRQEAALAEMRAERAGLEASVGVLSERASGEYAYTDAGGRRRRSNSAANRDAAQEQLDAIDGPAFMLQEITARADLAEVAINKARDALNSTFSELAKGSGSSKSGGIGDPFFDMVDGVEARIIALERERDYVGQSAEAVSRLKREYEAAALRADLLAKAKETGNKVTQQELAIIEMMVNDYTAAAAALDSAKLAQNELAESQKEAAKAAEANARAVELVGNQITGAITAADSFEDALKNVAVALANMAAQAALGGGPLGGLVNTLLGVTSGGFATYFSQPRPMAAPSIAGSNLTASGGLYADGSVFRGGRVVPFANGGVVDSPALFPMSGGRTGMMGEAGEEAILPLKRIGGKMGVVASGGGGTVVNVDARGSTDPVATEAAVRRAVGEALARVPGVIKEHQRRGRA